MPAEFWLAVYRTVRYLENFSSTFKTTPDRLSKLRDQGFLSVTFLENGHNVTKAQAHLQPAVIQLFFAGFCEGNRRASRWALTFRWAQHCLALLPKLTSSESLCFEFYRSHAEGLLPVRFQSHVLIIHSMDQLMLIQQFTNHFLINFQVSKVPVFCVPHSYAKSRLHSCIDELGSGIFFYHESQPSFIPLSLTYDCVNSQRHFFIMLTRSCCVGRSKPIQLPV